MEKLNQWLSLVANLGVIVGIFFLAFEIQTNTSAVRSATYQAFTDSSFSWADSEIENASALIKIYEKESFDELTEEESLLLNRVLYKAFIVMESNYLHYRAGTMDLDMFEARMSGSVGAIALRPLWREYFDASTILLPEFKQFLRARVEQANTP